MAICLKAPRTPLFVYYAINVSVTNFVCNSRCLYCVYCVYFAWVLCWLGLLPWYLNTPCIIRTHLVLSCTICTHLVLYYPHTLKSDLYWTLLVALTIWWDSTVQLFCIELNTVCSGFIVFTLLAEIHLDGPSMETFLSNRHTISDDHDWWSSSSMIL